LDFFGPFLDFLTVFYCFFAVYEAQRTR
jgi:hypothetical protein